MNPFENIINAWFNGGTSSEPVGNPWANAWGNGGSSTPKSGGSPGFGGNVEAANLGAGTAVSPYVDYPGYYDPSARYNEYMQNYASFDPFGYDQERNHNAALADQAYQTIYNRAAEYSDNDEEYSEFIKSHLGPDAASYDPTNPYTERLYDEAKAVYDELGISDDYRFSGLEDLSSAHNEGITNREEIGQSGESYGPEYGDFLNTKTQKDEFDWWLTTPEGQAFLADYDSFNDPETAYARLLATQDRDIIERVWTSVPGWLKNRYGYDDFDDFYDNYWTKELTSYDDFIKDPNTKMDAFLSAIEYGMQDGWLGDFSGYSEQEARDFLYDLMMARLADEDMGLSDDDLATANWLNDTMGYDWRYGRAIDDEDASYVPWAEYLEANPQYSGATDDRTKYLQMIGDKYDALNTDSGYRLGIR